MLLLCKYFDAFAFVMMHKLVSRILTISSLAFQSPSTPFKRRKHICNFDPKDQFLLSKEQDCTLKCFYDNRTKINEDLLCEMSGTSNLLQLTPGNFHFSSFPLTVSNKVKNEEGQSLKLNLALVFNNGSIYFTKLNSHS